jgi:hypothetical protein
MIACGQQRPLSAWAYCEAAAGAGYPQAAVAGQRSVTKNAKVASRLFADVIVEYVAMRPSPIDTSDTVVPFAPVRAENFSNDHDPLDKAGLSIMGLLQQAATTAKENCGHALRIAHGLSLQLRAAEDQIKDLEAQLRHFQDRAMRAENWLQRISREIEARFFEPSGGHQHDAPTRQNGPYSRKA